MKNLFNLFFNKNYREKDPEENHIFLLKKIGKGAFSDVWKSSFIEKSSLCINLSKIDLASDFCRDQSKNLYALKIVHSKSLRKSELHLLENEKNIWEKLKHKNIIHLDLFFAIESDYYFLTELMDETMLEMHNRMLRLGAKPKTITICNNLLQVINGLGYLHEKNIIHRDIKSENILVKENGECIKLSDFGLSRELSATCDMTSETGSYRWMAPEVIRHEPYNEKCDIYSFAILMFECLTLSIPFSVFSPIEVAIEVAKHGRRPLLPPTSEDMKLLIEDSWAQDSSQRPTCSQIAHRLETIKAKKESFGTLESAKPVSSSQENQFT